MRALAVDRSGNLYAGGNFTQAGGITASHVARWNGSAWSFLGDVMFPGTNDDVWALSVDGAGNLYAGGDFTHAGGVSASRIACWTGSAWVHLNNGPADSVSTP